VSEAFTEILEAAERATAGSEADKGALAGLLHDIDPADLGSPETRAYLAVLLDWLGMREQAMMALRPGDGDHESGMPNLAGMLASGHGEYEQARQLFMRALRATDDRTHLRAKVLANLAALSLLASELGLASLWLARARNTFGNVADPATHVLLASTDFGIARAHGDRAAMREAVSRLHEATRARIAELGSGHPLALTTVASLAAAEFELASAEESIESQEHAIAVLEVAAHRLAADLGADHPQALACLENLCVADFSLSRASRSPDRESQAASALESVSRRTTVALGEGHPQARTAAANAAFARLGPEQVARATADRIFGIDLGTTSSVIAYTDPTGTTEVIAGQDGNRIVPSVVYFGKDGSQVVGSSARQRAITEPERVATLFKRGMGEKTFLDNELPFVVDGKTWSPEELSASVLKKLALTGQERFGEPVRKVVITVPAYFGDNERAATKTAGEIAGLEVVHIVNEPTTAAIAHGLDNASTGRILVFDLGGGTFDVTVMDVAADGSMKVLATGGDRRLGGMDFDNLILDKMIATARQGDLDIETEPWARQAAYGKAEALKKELSTLETASTSLTGSGRPLPFELTRAEFEQLIKDKVTATEDTTQYTLETAELRPSDIGTVLMVGGSSRIPAFQKMLERVFGRPPVVSRNLDEDVARGAAMLGAKEGGDLDPRSALARMPKPVEVCSHGLGVSALNDDRVMQNCIIIPGQSPVPALGEDMFHTVEEGQTQVEIKLNEGDEEDLDYVKEIAKGIARLGRPVPKSYPIRVTISYNRAAMIELNAYDGQTGVHICKLEVERPRNLNMAQAANAAAALSKIKVG
jgi:molecular chaperone DnaK